eukprot:15716-Heterococcus_DN1.PRE.2
MFEDAYLCAVAPLGQGSLGEGVSSRKPAVEQPLGTEAHSVREQDTPSHRLISHAPCALLSLQPKMQRQQYAKYHFSLHNPKQFPPRAHPVFPSPCPSLD